MLIFALLFRAFSRNGRRNSGPRAKLLDNDSLPRVVERGRQNPGGLFVLAVALLVICAVLVCARLRFSNGQRGQKSDEQLLEGEKSYY
jgi:hypothetical protein